MKRLLRASAHIALDAIELGNEFGYRAMARTGLDKQYRRLTLAACMAASSSSTPPGLLEEAFDNGWRQGRRLQTASYEIAHDLVDGRCSLAQAGERVAEVLIGKPHLRAVG